MSMYVNALHTTWPEGRGQLQLCSSCCPAQVWYPGKLHAHIGHLPAILAQQMVPAYAELEQLPSRPSLDSA